ncbi:hypothetical protein BRARA_B00440 [Brassica rapa]|uniref:SHSP domain-containing protein n=1 Tax=Brassica campestris TaxID=3711 RepID=A0A398A630_BRACM|nr:hypothetical protein BRARA_B00440 [Brassica rapa]
MDFGRFPIISILEDMLEVPEEHNEKSRNNPSRAYMRDAKAMAATPGDVIEHPNAYVFVVDMPGIKGDEIKVQVENENVLVVSGERQRENKESEGVKYVRMERRMDFSSTGSDTNCCDCEIPCPTLYYPISTILSTLGLIGKLAWIYFWFPSQKASYY